MFTKTKFDLGRKRLCTMPGKASKFNAINLFYSLEMCEEEGGGCVELVAGGRELEVTALNVYDYVRKYAQHRMLLSQEKALEVLLLIISIKILLGL